MDSLGNRLGFTSGAIEEFRLQKMILRLSNEHLELVASPQTDDLQAWTIASEFGVDEEDFQNEQAEILDGIVKGIRNTTPDHNNKNMN